MANTPQCGGFQDVDSTDQAAAFISYLDESTRLSLAYKRHTYDLLNAREGAVLLEAGCGTGDDARALAPRVGATGRVVGVDASEAMIAEALGRCADLALPMEFRVADLHNLDFADDTFDACRIDRVLMHVADPARVIRELARVTKPGGVVLSFDIDWDSLVVDAPDREVTRAIRTHFCDSAIRNGWIGRQIPRLLRDAGLVNIQVEPFPELITEAAIGIDIWGLGQAADSAARAGVITNSQAEKWLASLRAAGESRQFFLCDLAFIVTASKP